MDYSDYSQGQKKKQVVKKRMEGISGGSERGLSKKAKAKMVKDSRG